MFIATLFSLSLAHAAPKFDQAACEHAIQELTRAVAQRQQAQDLYAAYPAESQRTWRLSRYQNVTDQRALVNSACGLNLEADPADATPTR